MMTTYLKKALARLLEIAVLAAMAGVAAWCGIKAGSYTRRRRR